MTEEAKQAADTATETELRELFSMDDEDEPLGPVIRTHSGEWVREGAVWRYHELEELSVDILSRTVGSS